MQTRWESRRPPVLGTLTVALSRCVARILTELQNLHTVEESSQVYLCFEDQRFVAGGLNTGNYHLYPSTRDVTWREHAAYVAESAVAILGSLLRSYANLRVDDSFKIKLHVLSAERSRARRRAPVAFRPPNEAGPATY